MRKEESDNQSLPRGKKQNKTIKPISELNWLDTLSHKTKHVISFIHDSYASDNFRLDFLFSVIASWGHHLPTLSTLFIQTHHNGYFFSPITFVQFHSLSFSCLILFFSNLFCAPSI